MNPQERIWKIGAIVGILLAIFLAVISVKELKSISYVGKSDVITNTISVNGKGEAVSIPDIATFSFTVTENEKTVAGAQEKATAKIAAALKGIKDGGVEDKDIKTTSYNINPHYDYQNYVCTPGNCPPSKSVLSGYDVSQTTEVKVRDLSKAGTLFTLIGAAGVQNIQGLNFTVDAVEKFKTEARTKAIADAKSKAEKIAKDLGVTLVRVTSFYDSTDNNVPMYYGKGGDMMATSVSAPMAAPEISRGEQMVTSNVTITYEIR